MKLTPKLINNTWRYRDPIRIPFGGLKNDAKKYLWLKYYTRDQVMKYFIESNREPMNCIRASWWANNSKD